MVLASSSSRDKKDNVRSKSQNIMVTVVSKQFDIIKPNDFKQASKVHKAL